MHEFATFEDFYPYYVGQHSRRATRLFHFAGTHAALALLATAAVTRRQKLAALAPVAAYGPAWFAHFVIEHNRPATFGHPLWSLRGDFAMLATMWRGGDGELAALAADVRFSVPLA